MSAADTPPSPDASTAAVRLRRWALRAALGLGAVAVVAAVAANVVLASLDRPWLKSRIQRLVRAQANLDIDYSAARIQLLSGARIDDLVVSSPTEFRKVAPELARVARIEVVWSPSSLFGGGAKLERVRLDGVEVTVASDESGRTSLDSLGPAAGPERPQPSRPGLPRSRWAREALGAAPPCERIEISGMKVTWVRARARMRPDRFTVRGLGARLEARREAGAWLLDASAGSPSAPLPLELEMVRDERRGTATLELWVTGELRPAGASAGLDLRVRSQELTPPLPVREVVHVEAAAVFDADRGETEISVERARAADGTATLEARLTLPDAPDAAVVVGRARGAADLSRLLGMAPAGVLPLEVERGELTWRAEGVEVALPPRFSPGGTAAAEARLARARLRLANGTTVSLASADGVMRVGNSGGHASLALRGLGLSSGRRRVAARAVDLGLDASQGDDRAWSGSAAAVVDLLRLEGPEELDLPRARVEARASALRLDPGSPLSAKGDVRIEGEAASLNARAPQGRAVATSVRFRLDAPLRGGPPYSARADVLLGLLRLYDSTSHLATRAPARLQVRVLDAVLDSGRPGATRMTVQAALEHGGFRASLGVDKHPDAVDFSLSAEAGGITAERVEPPVEGTGARPATAMLSVTGRVEGLGSENPRIEQQADLRLDRLEFGSVRAEQARLKLRSHGDLWRHTAVGELWLTPDGGSSDVGSGTALQAWAELDRRVPSLRFRLGAGSGVTASLSGSLSLDRERRGLRYDLDGHFAQLSPLAWLLSSVPGLDRIDVSRLEVDLAAHGFLSGVVEHVGTSGEFRLLPHVLVTAGSDGTLEVRARELHWQGPEVEVDAPQAVWRAELWREGPRRGIRSTFRAEELKLTKGLQEMEASGVANDLSAIFEGSLADGNAEVSEHLAIRALRHDLAAYPVGGLELRMAAQRRADGVVRLSELHVENAAAGTRLELRGGVDLGFERRRLSLRGQMQQDLARAWTQPETFQGRGQVAVTLRIDSSDLVVFRTQAALRLDDVHLRLPRAGVAIEALDGEIPVTADVAVEGGQVTLLRGTEENPYSLHRFTDQHPLLSRNSFLSIGSVASPFLDAAPVAGNLKVEQNIISVNQIEMGTRGGRVTGRCVLHWEGMQSTLQLHVRATGVLSSHGEPFDGNAALVVSAAERSIDGRIDILRIGSRHLLDLLDLQDPHRIDAATNRIRNALSFGYPDNVRVGFDHGFASMRVNLGGLAKFISIDELRGIPTGPLIDKMLATLPKSEEP
ncbi:MAG TPA: hypothetical protein VMK42_14175 [Anaeromyxobacteraceae bacterium]|nr:hypothetical protein [Anaeromyxobacteraceae bacterium]